MKQNRSLQALLTRLRTLWADEKSGPIFFWRRGWRGCC